jgi:NDP-sugar pyrophosphorylase family protein
VVRAAVAATRPGPGGLRALILAAGAGTRLRPLTDSLPKPLAPLAGRPVVSRLLDRLDLDVALNLHHGADLIRRVLGAGPLYLEEERLRGTAGALRGAAAFLSAEGDFLVLSADGAHDIDIGALAAAHRASRAAATITVKRIERPETCAIVEREGTRVVRFVEKPAPGEVFTDLASIGVYCFSADVLGLIPGERQWDIASDLIPALLDRGLPVHAYETEAWWSDIGDPAELLAANLRLGTVTDSRIAPGARIEPPVMIGPHSTVGAGALVRSALVLPGATVGRGRTVDGGIAGTGADVLRAWLR